MGLDFENLYGRNTIGFTGHSHGFRGFRIVADDRCRRRSRLLAPEGGFRCFRYYMAFNVAIAVTAITLVFNYEE